MGPMKKKGKKGVAASYVSRTRAIKTLQLSLTQFRDLCILKGIYPREPKNRKKAQKHTNLIQTLYHRKDMRFMLHEPLVWKFRALKVYMKKLATARGKKDMIAYERILKAKPSFRLDHLVKERYPTFVDALRDLDDPLSMCCLYATFPRMYKLPEAEKLAKLSRRLTTEFMLYVIEAKALRKVFVSIKGYYFQAEISGQNVTWVIPHNVAYEHPHGQGVDFKVMNTFTEFYVYLLGFVNFRLFQQLNLHYPPKLEGVHEGSDVSERLSALNVTLRKNLASQNEDPDNVQLDDIPVEEAADTGEEIRKEAESAARQQNLFKGLKFFLNNEVPREILTFVIRACGGQVSWNSPIYSGATYPEDDESITHQIVDRNDLNRPFLSRTYVQPQWVFDSINARERKPVEKYFAGVVLPAHLSPFFEYDGNVDADIESMEVNAAQTISDSGVDSIEEASESGSNSDVVENESGDDDEDVDDDDEEEEASENDEEEYVPEKPKMTVSAGKFVPENKARLEEKEDREHLTMRKMMIPRKHRRLYKNMMKLRKRKTNDERVLEEKRAQIASAKKNIKGKAK